MYTYHATVDRVVDGDTVDALIDLGFDTWKKVSKHFSTMGMTYGDSMASQLEYFETAWSNKLNSFKTS